MTTFTESTSVHRRAGAKAFIFILTALINILIFSMIPFLAQTGKKQPDYGEPATAVTMEKPQMVHEMDKAQKETEVKEKDLDRLPEEATMPEQDQSPPPKPQMNLDVPRFDLAPDAGGAGMAIAAPPEISSADSVFSLNELDHKPRLVSRIQPVYPYEARRNGIQGKVMLQFIVNKSGHVSNIKVVNAEPEGVFEENAIEAVSKWRFEPGKYRGDPVDTRVTLPIRFEM